MEELREYILLKIDADMEKQRVYENNDKIEQANFYMGKIKAYQDILETINYKIELNGENK